MSIATCLFALPWIFALGLPSSTCWPYLLGSALVHLFYLELLVVSYRTGDLSAAYPIARGSSPILVCLGGWLFAGETLSRSGCVGVVLISAGIFLIARDRGQIDKRTMLASVATGFCIAAYTVLDGLGIRQTSEPLAYNAWLFATYGGILGFRFLMRSGWRGAWGPTGNATDNRRRIALAGAGGVVSIFAYALVTLAMRRGEMGLVSALRETSVLFAAVIGYFFLREPVKAARLTACAIIVAGILILAR